MSELGKKRLRIGLSLADFLVVIPAVLVGGVFMGDRHYAAICAIIVVLALLPFFLLFENRKMRARELVPIAVMTAIAVVGRMAFYFLPQFKPIVALVIITGVAFGSEAGFLSGSLAMLVSNFYFGQGPWTPWQMFACGLIGYISGLFGKRKSSVKVGLLCVWGFFSCLLYGLFVDTWALIGFSYQPDWAAVALVYLQGLYFNLILAAATVATLALVSQPLLAKLERIKIKYGLMPASQAPLPAMECFAVKEASGFEPLTYASPDSSVVENDAPSVCALETQTAAQSAGSERAEESERSDSTVVTHP